MLTPCYTLDFAAPNAQVWQQCISEAVQSTRMVLIYMYIHIVYTYRYMHTNIYTLCIRVYIHTYIHNTYIHTYVYVYIHALYDMVVCVYIICIHTYIHACMHTHSTTISTSVYLSSSYLEASLDYICVRILLYMCPQTDIL